MKSACVVPLLVLALTVTLATPASGQTPAAPHVVRFSPEGVVKGVRQVVVRFSAAMVPLGDPRPAGEVFEIACPEAGTARWVDSREWAYDFARDLPAGVRCTFRLRAGLAALDGTAIGGRHEFAFSTGGPSIERSSLPRAGSQWIDEEQAFLLVLDAPVDERSLLAHAYFVVEGVASRVGARLVTGKDREAILASRGTGLPKAPIVILQARQRFPSGANVALVWDKGIATTTGVATTEEQRREFRVRPAFEVRFTCERERKDADCLPVAPLRVTFSAPVPWAQASRLALVGPGNLRWKAETRDSRDPLHWDVTFRAPFPERATLSIEMPADLVDDAGRRAVNAARFPLTVKTAAFPPLAKFAARFGILERADPVLPVTLRRLEPEVKLALVRADRESKGAVADWLERVKASVLRVPPEASADILPWLRRVAEAKRETSIFASANGRPRVTESVLPRPGSADAFEVVGLPLGRPGLYVVELESARLGQSLLEKPGPMYVPTAALVTNLGVHFKWGAENALVWVTALDRGRPVGGARVTIQDCAGAVRWRGETDAQGIARVTGLPTRAATPRCEDIKGGSDWEQSRALRDTNDGLLVIAQTHDDLGLVHSSWDDGIQPWRFNLPGEDERGALRAHTILDRPLFRAGETVHMKHVIRRPSLDGFEAVAAAVRPGRAVLQHVGSDEKYELPLAWSAAGTAETTWAIPAGARLGTYSITLVGPPLQRPRWMREDRDDTSYPSGTFRVEEFRLPTLRATLRPPTEALVDVSDVALDVAVTYLSGGGARRLPVTLRAQLQPHPFSGFEGFENFVFANGAVTEGVTRRGRGGDEDDDDEGDEAAPRGRPAVHQRESLTLDDHGTGRTTVGKLPRGAVPRDLLVELEYRDPSGEVHTAARRLTLWPSTRLVGLVPEGGEVFGETLKAHAAVIDLAGRPVAGVPVTVDVFERKLYSHRKRLVGGFYAYEHVQEVRRLGELCRGTTSVGGIVVCEGKAPATGSLVLQARAADDRGRTTVANVDAWVVDPEAAWWFDVREHDRMDVLPERRRWEPGETARFQVRLPFREATALVTTEREGVLDARVVALAGSQPIVELPVLDAWAPNVFVSVLAVRGRVGGVQPTAFVDLGRPAFKLGIAEIRVGWRAHELKVSVAPERDTYRVRERARVRIAVRTADGNAPPAGSEVALAAVDEALLELAPNPSWDLLPAMLARRGHALLTSTAQLHVVGKRHFGLKALPTGGGGGRQTTRELFDTLLYWNPRVTLDERGEATVEIPLNDSLTSFRVVAVATSGLGRFGTGAGTLRTTQDLMLLAGLPPLVRSGDRFAAELTLRNTTARPMDVIARARVDGLGAALEPRAATLAPGEARAITWDVTVPPTPTALGWEIEAGERGGAMDRLRLTQKVAPAVPVRTYQATLAQAVSGQPIRQAVERPSDALPSHNGVRVALAPTLLSGVDPLREWMTRYPYTCLEQEVSRAVALRDAARWQALIDRLPAHVDGDGLLKYFPGSPTGSDALTAYVTAVAHAAGFAIPADLQKRLDAGLTGFVEGKIRRGSDIPRPDLTLRKLAALEALSRRGGADARLVSTIAAEPNLWPTSGVLDWWNVLRRVSGVPQRAARLTEAERIVRARLNVQGTTMGFSTEAGDRLWWLMVSNDVNAVRLVLTLLEAGLWRDELPRLMRGALGRQQRGVWDLTVANAWGALAVERFAREYEKTPVAGVTTATLGAARQRLDWAASPRGGALGFAWPAAADEMVVAHEGAGQPWVTVETRAAIPLKAPLSSGYRITRTLTAVERRDSTRWSRGDIVRMRLEVEAQADMTWVVVNDPIPSGASHLGRGLGGESAIATGGESESGRAWPAFQERAFDGFRAYYRFVPKGTLVTEYTVRLNQPGRFVMPTTRVEALYAPEMFGEIPNDVLEVAP